MGSQYVGKGLGPIYEKLDWVLMVTEWELKSPLATVHALDRIETLSYRAPIIHGSNSVASPYAHRPFKFDLDRLHHN